jgi:hypothetical protein
MAQQHARDAVGPVGGRSWATSYPRPQFIRQRWLSLDGVWQFSRSALPDGGAPRTWEDTITVPYAPEAPLSGVGDRGYHPVVWYRREFEIPAEWNGQRVLLHFGAVDYRARVWVNGGLVVEHEGGHTPFTADITERLRSGLQEVVVRAEDDPLEMDKPRGKQDWQEAPHAIWYPRTSGIWQSVWLEPVAEVHIDSVRFTADVASFSICSDIRLRGDVAGLELDVTLSLAGETLAHDTLLVASTAVLRRFQLPDPGIGDARRDFLWSPEHPNLIDVTLRLRRGDRELDRVESYTALRDVAVGERQFLLNGRSYFLRLVLDQGYWRDGLMTPPAPDDLRRDVELTKALGFNGVRKHQKLEDPRYLYWADRLGLLVWEELPSAYAFTPRTLPRLTREWLEAIQRDFNHPCIATWVPFNESWGVPDLPLSPQQRDAVRALHALAKALDPTRPAVGNDGWEFVAGDLFTIHDYLPDAEALTLRYADRASVEATLNSYRPGGRSLRVEPVEIGDRPVILSEFGGIRFSQEADGWGYSEVGSTAELSATYRALIRAASGAGLAGFCYTQLTDTFQEQNGLLTMDREPKADLEALARATRNEPER